MLSSPFAPFLTTMPLPVGCVSRIVQACVKNNKMVDRLQGLCGQLELDVEGKRLNLAALQAGTA